MVRRLLAVLLAILIAAPAQAGWLDVPPTTLLNQSNIWAQLQYFDAGLDVRYSSVLFDRLSVNSSGNLLIQATEKAPGACTAALAGLGAGNVNTGTHSYKVTFVTAGGETDAGAVSGTVTTTAGDGQVSLSAIPTGSTAVTSRKIYRTAAGNAITGPWLLLATIADNSTTTYADNIADASLTTAIPSANTAIDTRVTVANSGLTTFSAGLTVSGGNLIAPTLIGGTGTTSTLTLQSTSGVGATDAIIFLVGSNGATEAGRALNNGYWGFGTSTPAFDALTPIHVAIDGGTVGYANVGIGMNTSGTSTGVGQLAFYNANIGAADKRIATIYALTGSATNSGELQFYTYSSGSIGERLRIDSGGQVSVLNKISIGGAVSIPSGTILDLRAGDLTFSGANGQKYVQGYKTELTTIAAAATTATTITIPANAILKSVGMRVTVQPPGTATMVVTATTSGTVLQQGASMSTAINTTDVGTRAWGTNYVGVAAQTITITPNAVPSDTTGRVRFDIYYDEPTAPTS